MSTLSLRILPRLLIPLAVFAAIPVRAQITMVSNLNELSAGPDSPAADTWYATSFTTDNSAGGWTLSGLTLLMANADVPAGNFFVAIYSETASKPGTLLSTLNGSSNPATAGQYTYTPSGIFNLAPNSTYFVAAGVTSGTGSYAWESTTSDAESGSWIIGDRDYDTIDQGSLWRDYGQIRSNLFSVSVTAVPEPSTYAALAGLGMLGFAAWQRRLRAQRG